MSALLAEIATAELTTKRALLRAFVYKNHTTKYDWSKIGRPSQQTPEGRWRVWFIKAGRGWGKTRTGGEECRKQVKRGRRRLALVGATAADVRDTMIEGESGIMAIHPDHERPTYEPSKRRLTWPNGAIATLYSADEPERLRGPQHDFAWADELASWRYPAAWDMLQFGLRLGDNPQVVVTTTPKPRAFIKKILSHPKTVVTHGSLYENKDNLAEDFVEYILGTYEGTRLGRQEIDGEFLEDTPGALWTHDLIEQTRWIGDIPPLSRIVVAIDPAVSVAEESDETGISVVGKGLITPDMFEGRMLPDFPFHVEHGFVLADRGGRLTPQEWADRAVSLYHEFEADAIVAEVNNGGNLVTENIRTRYPSVRVRSVTATRGKVMRAEPVAGFFEQGRAHMTRGFPLLEDQLCSFVPGQLDKSPDRVDAMVWAFHDLMVKSKSIKAA